MDGRDGVALGELPVKLEQAKRNGLEHVDELIARYAVPPVGRREWRIQYLTVYLKYDIAAAQLLAIRLFHELAVRHGLIETPRPIALYEGAPLP